MFSSGMAREIGTAECVESIRENCARDYIVHAIQKLKHTSNRLIKREVQGEDAEALEIMGF